MQPFKCISAAIEPTRFLFRLVGKMVLLVICELSKKSVRLGKLLCDMTWFGQCRQRGDLRESTCWAGGNLESYGEGLVWRSMRLEVRESNRVMNARGGGTLHRGWVNSVFTSQD